MPFRVVYGCDPPPLIPYQPDSAKVAAIDRQLGDRDVFLADVKEYLLHAQELMRSHYDGHHRDVQFVVGDCVWLRLHQRMAATLKDKAASKLTPRFYGPFRVEARIGPVAYRLQRPPPPPPSIHPVFHVVFLKKFVGDLPTEVVQLPPMKNGRVLPVPAHVLKARLNRGQWQILVLWLVRPAANVTWEMVTDFKQQHPDFQFPSEGGSVVDAFVGRVYQRRRRTQQQPA